MKPRTKVLAASAAACALLSLVAIRPASATGNVIVSLTSVSPTRTVSITDLSGNDLTSAGLSLGSTNPASRSLSFPFAVKVSDTTMTPSTFNIQAEMSNLYLCGSGCPGSLPGTAPSGINEITSPNLNLSYSSANMAVSSVSALVAPLFNLTGTVTNSLAATESVLGLCAYIETLNTSLVGLDTCAAGTGIPISISDLAGYGQSIARTVDLSSLSSLPLIPQAGSTGAFTNPVYGVGVVPSGYGTDASPTALTMVQGSLSSDASLLTTLAGLVSGTGAAPNSYIDTNAIKSALRTSLGVVNTGTTNLGDQVWDTLSAADQNTIVGALTASVVPMGTIGSCVSSTATCLVGLSGTYQSFPVLNVTVPSGTASGNFEGTLVVTGF